MKLTLVNANFSASDPSFPAVHLFSLYVLMTKKCHCGDNVPKYLFKKANIFHMSYLYVSRLPWQSRRYADCRVNTVVLHSKSYMEVGEVIVLAELHNLAQFIALIV